MIKRIFVMISAICLTLPILAGCAAGGAENELTSEEMTTDVQTEPVPAKLLLTDYVIVRPDMVGNYYSERYQAFVKTLKTRTGENYTYTNDFVKEGTRYKEAEYEILLGPTNRKETAAVMEGHSKNYYAITVTGTKIVISGNSRASLEYALNTFLKKCITRGSAEIDRDINICGEYTEDEYFEVLEGIKLVAIGDSYFGADKEICWPKLLADDYNMKLQNNGIGGSTLSNYDTTHHPMCDRWQQMSPEADIVLLEGGRNDFNVKAPIGDLESRDTKTVAGAINVILDGLQQKYPNSLIICITAWYVNDSMQPYVNVMKNVCAKRGVVCFDASDQQKTGVYMNNAAFRASYCQDANDISHLNADGMALVEPVFEKFIAEEYQKFLAAR